MSDNECRENKINRLVDELTNDFNTGEDIGEFHALNCPDTDKLVEIIYKLQKIIFSGYFKNKSYKFYTPRNNLTMLLEDVIFNLTRQISIVLKGVKGYENLSEEEVLAKSEDIVFEFSDKLTTVRSYLETDVQAAYDGDPAAYSYEEIIYSYPGLFAIFVNRIAHELYLLNVPLIPRMMTEYAHGQTGIDIHPGATIGKYFFIDHGTGIVIGETTVIGENVKIYQGVTLGALSTRGGQKLKSKKRHPTIMDNVTIYSGASILGGETVIGKDVVIGGNAFITTSVPQGAKVSIKNQELCYNYDPAHPIERKILEQDDSWFYII